MNNLAKISWLVTVGVLMIGFTLLHFEFVSYGFAFFVAFPLGIGFSIGTLDRKFRWLTFNIMSLAIFFIVLLTIGWEGLICVLMAFPILLLNVKIGHWARHWYGKRTGKTDPDVFSSFYPLVILVLVNWAEEAIIPEPKIEVVETSEFLPFAAEDVFHAVKSMDKLDGKKPLALRVGLPTPYKCVLPKDTIGALRVCLFKNGEIVAKITKYEPGKVLEMDVVSYSLTGRDWFEFIDAKYSFESDSIDTKITRTSSYKSSLYPRMYWAPLEKWGIEQEHLFVLRSLEKNLFENKKNFIDKNS